MGPRAILAAGLMLAGAALALAPAFWSVRDPTGDARTLAVTAGVCLLALGAATGWLRYRRRLIPATGPASGFVLIGLAGALLLLAPLFAASGTMFLQAALTLAALLIGSLGVFRALSGFMR